MSYFNSEIVNNFGDWFRPLIGKAPYNKKSVTDASLAVEKAVQVIEKHLLNNTFLVGERITLADLFCAPLLNRGFQYFFDKEWRAQHPNTTRWYETLVNQPILTAVAEKLPLLEKPALTNVAPKKPEAPKEAPKPAAKAAQTEEEPAAAPKAKHPLAELPKASFPLDEWKAIFSNSRTAGTLPEAMKTFWEKVPFEEYSIWLVDYKDKDYLNSKMVFQNSNLLGGFDSRLEFSRKFLFGVGSVYGKNFDNDIRAAFVIRGQDYLPVFSVTDEYDGWEYTKLDPKKAEDRAALEFVWLQSEEPLTLNGKEYTYDPSTRAFKVFK